MTNGSKTIESILSLIPDERILKRVYPSDIILFEIMDPPILINFILKFTGLLLRIFLRYRYIYFLISICIKLKGHSLKISVNPLY